MSEQPVTPQQRAQSIKILHNTALFALIACPIVIAIPPRKLDIYTISLRGGTVFSANYLHRERYGRSILQRFLGNGQRQVALVAPAHDERLNQPSLVKHNSLQLQISPNEKQWVAERRIEEEEAAQEGKGIFDMMADQFKEVFTGKKDD